MFKAVFNKLHEHSYTGIKITYNTFSQYYYIPYLEKWLSIFIHDCIECQRNKHFNQKIQTAPTQSFSEHAPSFNYRISMDTKGPINPPSHNKSYILVIVDAFSHFVVTVPTKSNNAKTAIKTLLHHWIIKFGPPIYLVTDRGSEYVNKEMAQLCTLMGISHSPRTAYSPWTNGLVEVQNRNLGTHLRMFHPERNFTHVQFSDKLKLLRIGPYKIIDRLSDVTYELPSQDGSTIHVHRNHLIPYYPKEPLIYPHLRDFMRFSDTTQIQVPQPIKYANSDSSPFNSDESLSDDDSQTSMTPFSTDDSSQKTITPSSTVTPYNTPFVPSSRSTLFETSNHNSLTTPITNDNTLYRNIINTPHTNFPTDRSRHSSQTQTDSLPPLIDRTTKTTYKLRHQPKVDYRLFIPPSQLYS